MRLLRQTYEFEYRTADGADCQASADLWVTVSGNRAVVVLRGCTTQNAQDALNVLHHTWLPYLLRPEAAVLALALRPARKGFKTRALVLPLSA
ncbi:hypothetical protein [Deinococcus arenicola]|uniref:Uncharacterized protein n=1 Tax=Deinococcus arenicola TaxID=2994950 RepID=A0ABU4DU52_9DEIO|nr:hypothetical protein [Deinococcus sp. ZS9-10]MDV6375962.1 hypothetical protein [Deinococcus sp. ZS9-10]